MTQLVKNPPAMQETWVRSLGWEDPLEKQRLPTSVFWPVECHGLYSSWGHKELDTTEQISLQNEQKQTVTFFWQMLNFVFNERYNPTGKSSGTDVVFRMLRKLKALVICLFINYLFALISFIYISWVQSLSSVWLFATPWIAARQGPLSITNSWSLLKLMCIESVMSSSHLILCCCFFSCPQSLPS